MAAAALGPISEGSAGRAPPAAAKRGEGIAAAAALQEPWGVGAGLQNLGNTCYVNAALQCLSHTPPLASWLVSRQHATLCPAGGSCTLCAMQAHVTRALLHAGEVIRPHRDLLAGFHRHQQEDAHEFLMFTLNGMQQGCLSASQQSGHASEDTSVVRQIFGGTWRSQIQCLHCLGVSDTFDPYLDISLDITAAQSVEQALRELVKPEKLEAENAYDCGVCLRKVPATKRLTLHRTSQVLVLVLKRFTQLSGAKRAQEVRYPQCLDMQPYTSERKAGPLGYVLYAVLVHSGWSCERGHYLCYIRAGSGQWYKMDDAKVTACDETAALSQSAYVLFYAREGFPGGHRGRRDEPLCQREGQSDQGEEQEAAAISGAVASLATPLASDCEEFNRQGLRVQCWSNAVREEQKARSTRNQELTPPLSTIAYQPPSGHNTHTPSLTWRLTAASMPVCSSKAQPATPTWCLLVAHASIAGLTGTFIQVFKERGVEAPAPWQSCLQPFLRSQH
nr:ubiquitin carboxyl-terminal hydrolase 17-like protein 6 [Ovis aries]